MQNRFSNKPHHLNILLYPNVYHNFLLENLYIFIFNPYRQFLLFFGIFYNLRNRYAVFFFSIFHFSISVLVFQCKRGETNDKYKSKSGKPPGFDLVTSYWSALLKEMSDKGDRFLKILFDAIIDFPSQCKLHTLFSYKNLSKNQIKLSHTYRPISMLPIISKVFEKLFLTRLKPILYT